jgi:hypothetical protein
MGADRFHLEAAPAGDAVSRVDAAGQEMTSQWQAVAAEVAGLAGQLGRGELGAAFLAGYRAPAEQVSRAADRYSGAPGRIAGAAGAGIGDYQSTDASAGDLFRGIPPGALP